MCTAEQLKEAHSKVKSGADFPKYMQEIKGLGVTSYEVCLADGRSYYYGDNKHTIEIAPKYPPIIVSQILNRDYLIKHLKAHQEGKTDYLTFIKMCAETGVEKWKIRINDTTCTYIDHKGNEILKENIAS